MIEINKIYNEDCKKTLKRITDDFISPKTALFMTHFQA